MWVIDDKENFTADAVKMEVRRYCENVSYFEEV